MNNITIYFHGSKIPIDIPKAYEVIASGHDKICASIEGDLCFSSWQRKFEKVIFYNSPCFWLCLIRKKKKEKKKVG